MSKICVVTGASGFLGINLVKRLLHEGWEVHGITRKKSSLFRFAPFPGFHIHLYDGTPDSMKRVTYNKPDVVFNLASLFIRDHYCDQNDDISQLIDANIKMGAHLLEAMSFHGCKKLVNTGTSWQHYNKNDNGYSPVNFYAATKQAFSAIIQYYHEAHNISCHSLHLSDTYGPNDKRGKLFNMLKNCMENGGSIDMTKGEQLIDLVYVDDTIDAFVRAANITGHENKIYGVSSGNPKSLKEIVEKYLEITGMKLNVNWGARPYREREVMFPWVYGDLVPGWWAKTSLTEGIKKMECII